MAKSNPKPKQTRNERTVTSPHTGKVSIIAGTKAGKKRAMRNHGDPDRTHDGKLYRSNEKRFDPEKKKRKRGILDPAAQFKRTQTDENPFN